MTILTTWGLAAVLCSSFFVCALLVLTQRWHGRLSLDHDLRGVQKIHSSPVPRVGGVGLAAGFVIGAIVSLLLDEQPYPLVVELIFCSLPTFLAGLIEDLTKRVSVRTRLYASFCSAALAAWAVGSHLTRLDTPGLDSLMSSMPAAVLFTCFAVGGTTHAVNIVDGLNGLAAGCVTLMLAGLAAIAWQVGDVTVMTLCLLGVAALIGFLLLNFPFGRIFLGDGGAYLAGFWVAQCGVLLLHRNPSVSTWAVLLCCLYPVWETLYSMYRRHIQDGVSSGRPDMTHMHHLVYRRIADRQVSSIPSWRLHGKASVSIWLPVALCSLIGAIAYNQTPVLATAVFAFLIAYNITYKVLLEKNTRRVSFSHSSNREAFEHFFDKPASGTMNEGAVPPLANHARATEAASITSQKHFPRC